MVRSHFVQTTRIKMHYLERAGEGPVLFLLHGNGSSSVFWKRMMARLPKSYRAIAPDLRGYGYSEAAITDATKGFGDYVEDIISLMDALEIDRAHFVGHSLGGGMLFSFAVAHAQRIQSLTLVNPASPFGFGGTKGLEGMPCNTDFAGSGGGIVNPEFVKRLKANDLSASDENASPRAVMNRYYWKPPFVPDNMDELLESLFQEKIGEKHYPGDFVKSSNFPFVAPGQYGPMNAGSPKYLNGNAGEFIRVSPKPNVLWVRGSHDEVVSDESVFDLGTLGRMGLVPGYPGKEQYPPQPMVSQTRHVLEQYAQNGGHFIEEVMQNTGHTPFIEQPEIFRNHLTSFIQKN